MKPFASWLAILSLAAFWDPSAPAQSPAPIATPGPLERQIVAKEREGLDALKTGDLDRFAALTSEDAVFVDAAGSASKQQVMKNVAGFRLTGYTIEDLKFIALSSKSGLITYKIAEQGVSHGKDFKAEAYVSSIWAKRAGHWVCLFSQETSTK